MFIKKNKRILILLLRDSNIKFWKRIFNKVRAKPENVVIRKNILKSELVRNLTIISESNNRNTKEVILNK